MRIEIGGDANMDNPGARSLMDTVRKINQMAQSARSGESGIEDYLRGVSSDPMTEWFTEILREKNEELEKEKQRTDQLACALRSWYQSRPTRDGEEPPSTAEAQLINILHEMQVVNPQEAG